MLKSNMYNVYILLDGIGAAVIRANFPKMKRHANGYIKR